MCVYINPFIHSSSTIWKIQLTLLVSNRRDESILINVWSTCTCNNRFKAEPVYTYTLSQADSAKDC